MSFVMDVSFQLFPGMLTVHLSQVAFVVHRIAHPLCNQPMHVSCLMKFQNLWILLQDFARFSDHAFEYLPVIKIFHLLKCYHLHLKEIFPLPYALSYGFLKVTNIQSWHLHLVQVDSGGNPWSWNDVRAWAHQSHCTVGGPVGNQQLTVSWKICQDELRN